MPVISRAALKKQIAAGDTGPLYLLLGDDDGEKSAVAAEFAEIVDEGLRAFKRTTILGYEIPWNNFDFAYQAYFALQESHVEKKVAALSKYASQQHRRYSDPEYIRNVARTHGINVNREFAEVFEVYRVVT